MIMTLKRIILYGQTHHPILPYRNNLRHEIPIRQGGGQPAIVVVDKA